MGCDDWAHPCQMAESMDIIRSRSKSCSVEHIRVLFAAIRSFLFSLSGIHKLDAIGVEASPDVTSLPIGFYSRPHSSLGLEVSYAFGLQALRVLRAAGSRGPRYRPQRGVRLWKDLVFVWSGAGA